MFCGIIHENIQFVNYQISLSIDTVAIFWYKQLLEFYRSNHGKRPAQ
ncbi:MAG: hypothetical protein K0S20_244 [Patescibacteria group bacterium]|nr:hypothetical protein [Patescibacteria group bacterium]